MRAGPASAAAPPHRPPRCRGGASAVGLSLSLCPPCPTCLPSAVAQAVTLGGSPPGAEVGAASGGVSLEIPLNGRAALPASPPPCPTASA
eukprot:scaffold11488_cov109-Isochrysis_galbana.AAC.1